MKTQIVKPMFLIATLLQLTALFMMSCSSGGGGSTAATPTYSLNSAGQCVYTANQTIAPYPSLCTTTSTNGYGYINNQCVLLTNPTVAVTPTLCQTTGTNGYGYVNNQCVLLTNPTVAVTPTLCQGTTGTNGYGYVNNQCVLLTNPTVAVTPTLCQSTGIGGVGQCVGQFSYYGQIGTCQTIGSYNNCSGWTLINVSTGQTQYCQ